jgi:hypothetical protein
MVLIAKTTKPAADEGQSTELTGAPGDVLALRKTRSSTPGESDEFCDILRTPLLAQDVNDSNSGRTQILLTPVQQAAVLAQCLHVSRRSRSDEMSGTLIFSFLLLYTTRYICSVLNNKYVTYHRSQNFLSQFTNRLLYYWVTEMSYFAITISKLLDVKV